MLFVIEKIQTYFPTVGQQKYAAQRVGLFHIVIHVLLSMDFPDLSCLFP